MTDKDIISDMARKLWSKDHPGRPCPDGHIPTLADLAAWLPEFPEAAHLEAGERLAKLYGLTDGGRCRWKPGRTVMGKTWRSTGRTTYMPNGDMEFENVEVPNAEGIPVGTIRVTLNAEERPGPDGLGGGFMGTLEKVHKAWMATPDEHRPKHPLAPLVKAWQERPRHPGKATVTTAAGMTRRPELVSTLRRTTWADHYSLETVPVDGEPMTARMPDLVELFPEPKRRLRRLYKPVESRLPLRVDGVRELPRDLRLVALEGLPGVLAGDVLALACLAHGIDRPMLIDERNGAALLARTRDGGFRSPKATDIKRFWQAAADLRAALMYDPHGSGRWADLAKVEPVPNRRGIVIGRPTWMGFLKGNRWTLTAEGGRAGKARIVAGEGGAAGRLITGIEYRLAARWDGRPGIAPDLRPESKGGPGHPVFIPWRDAMNLMGDVWNRADGAADYAARFRWRRMVQSLLKAGYRIHNLRGEAKAGDSVEVLEVVKGGRSRPAGLRVRASARFVEAARLSTLKDGRGFETVRLTDWLPPGVKWK